MALATSNLKGSDILGVIDRTTLKEIFRYSNGNSRSLASVWVKVCKWGLSSYCPGADADAKLTNLRADKKLSYFKGYKHILIVFSTISPGQASKYGGTLIQELTCIDDSYSWEYVSKSASWLGAPSPSTGSGTTGVWIVIPENTGVARSATMTFKGEPLLYGGNEIEITLNISQAGAGIPPPD